MSSSIHYFGHFLISVHPGYSRKSLPGRQTPILVQMKEKNFLQISLNLVKVLTANLHRMQSLIIAELPPAILHQLVSMDLPAPLFGTCFPPISHLVTHFQLECEFRSSTMAEMLSALAAIPFLKTFNMSQNYFPTCPRITLVKTQFQRSVWFWKA